MYDAQVLGISGIGIVLFEFGAYPWIVDRIGIVAMQRWSGIISIGLYLALPNVKYLSWNITSLLVIQIIMLAILECANTAVSIFTNLFFIFATIETSNAWHLCTSSGSARQCTP